jgi:hypothetical protein
MLFLGTTTGNCILLNTTTFEVVSELSTFHPIKFTMLTPKHLIIINDQNKFEYFEVDYTGKIERQEADKEYFFGNGNIVQIFYNEDFQKMVVGCEKGEIYTLAIPAEKIEDEEEVDEEENNERQKEKIISVDPVLHGCFHNGPVTFVAE